MTEIRIGYARCSTDKQDLTAQQEALVKLGVSPDRIYLDKGLTGSNRQRPGLDQALAAVRSGDTLVVPNLTVWPVRYRMRVKLPMPCRQRRKTGTGNQHL
jgi:DNA invertase Pin-like site-specific DNA recombinase